MGNSDLLFWLVMASNRMGCAIGPFIMGAAWFWNARLVRTSNSTTGPV
jgi:hypothetical protein